MIELGPCEITSLFGPVASGKTYLMQQLTAQHPRKIVFDATGEAGDNDPDCTHIWHSPRKLAEELARQPYVFNIVYHPAKIQVDFFWVIKILWRLPVHKLLVCDEVHQVMDVYKTPEYAKTMMRFARHNHLAFVAASQRMADVSKLLTEFSRQTIQFNTHEATSLSAIADRFGNYAADAVQQLRPLIFDDVNKKAVQLPQCIVFKKASQLPLIYDFKTETMTPLQKGGKMSTQPTPEPGPQSTPPTPEPDTDDNSEPVTDDDESD